jgi:MerR family copper efflux transcriptional regulator
MNIGQAAGASGVNAKMIRYYESIGLIGPAQRSEAGYRQYSGHDVQTLRFIHRSRELGFSIERIRTLLSLWQDRARHSADVKALAEKHIAELDDDIAKLRSIRAQLVAVAEHCYGDERAACPILEELADPGTGTRCPSPSLVRGV